ncbi:phosphatase PAP2 family protein [Komagataeibacter sp. FNDCR2]|uniref:phosphatase PAP2 family protein n=1 Tax=Komagataeibacter sp. FNDCR2 TaxID=2878682 RepID=UPI001E339545|nr:phosphatase PAP2 family protein [Komagataeibacter sp. FNDCR2]
MRFITDFGDEATIIPLFVVTIVLFIAMGWKRNAAIWGIGIFLTFGCIVLSKMLGLLWAQFYGYDGHPFSASGHVASSSAVYGSLINMIFQPRFHSWLMAMLPPALIAALIGYTRIMLHAHTPMEVVAGAGIGTTAATLIARVLPPVPTFLVHWFAFALVPVILFFHGYVMEAEPVLKQTFYTSYYFLNQNIGW